MAELKRTCISVTQPIGTFYLISLSAEDLIRRVNINPRTISADSNQDVQRAANPVRVKEIARYVQDPDATFPTAVIIAVNSLYTEFVDSSIIFKPPPGDDSDDFIIGELLDGQHRILGLQQAKNIGINISDFEIPVVVMVDLDAAEKAYVFSIINSKQTPVSKSLIYDLFGLSKERSPYSVCHEIARAMNTDPEGPFFRGLKMLGKRQLDTEMLTQGSFVKYLLRSITNKPDEDAMALKTGDLLPERDRPFNAFFRNKKDELILKAMTNYFQAIKETFPGDWSIESYLNPQAAGGASPVMRRTVGYEALMRALSIVWPEVQKNATLEKDFFLAIAQKFKENVKDLKLTTEEFGSSSADAGRLSAALTKDMVKV